jgi:hypothetical protein
VDIEHLISSFDTVADEFEKSFWGAGSFDGQLANKNNTTFFYPTGGGGSDYLSQNQDELADSGFNILIGYGPMNEKNGMKASETAHSIIGVQITGVSQIIGGEGQPVAEQYTFIAKDLDGDVTKRA